MKQEICNIGKTALDYVNSIEYGIGCCTEDYSKQIALAYKNKLDCESDFCVKKEPCDNVVSAICNITFTVAVDDTNPACPHYTVIFTIENLTGFAGNVTYQWLPKDNGGVNWDGSSTSDTIVMNVLTPGINWEDIMFAIVTDELGCQAVVQTIYNWSAIDCEICLYPESADNPVFVFPTNLNTAVFTT